MELLRFHLIVEDQQRRPLLLVQQIINVVACSAVAPSAVVAFVNSERCSKQQGI
ncbi:conserved hypothetical protein [Ricinus communis]|uniref:Uncharacterized protein n=1 Tax=Ricinus communis TaxID=3988 RepID=B9SYU1_RICCO|nr:conserved hypothetical protein [Ricinus communis]